MYTFTMRIRIARLIAVVVVFLNLFLLYCIWSLLFRNTDESQLSPVKAAVITAPPVISIKSLLEKSISIVVRKFEAFDNDVTATVESIKFNLPNASVYIVSDGLPYPPLNFDTSDANFRSAKIINTQFRFSVNYEKRNPLYYIDTKYVLFIPDSTRLSSENVLYALFSELKKQPQNIISAPFTSTKSVDCLNINLNVKEWVIQYDISDVDTCDAVKGKHALLMESETLKKFPEPLMLPFPDALYIQAASLNIKTKLVREILLSEGKQLFKSHHAQWKLQQLEQGQQREMFRRMGLKKVIRETGAQEWYGCSRETPRCFGTVIDDMPQYLWEGKWTPPCCLAGLRRTARHVFDRLDEAGVRYWLEGGSLLGAMRSGDILPWDYDVDIGMLREDIGRCPWLSRASTQSVVDNDGFVWEKAVEGDFFRVQFSRVNHLHVDIFPFYQRNGTMTKDTWFPTHRQDREFPEHFLHPMASIEFVGREVPAPNNIRDFLEYKFGKGVIENPEYPNPRRMKFTG